MTGADLALKKVSFMGAPSLNRPWHVRGSLRSTYLALFRVGRALIPLILETLLKPEAGQIMLVPFSARPKNVDGRETLSLLLLSRVVAAHVCARNRKHRETTGWTM